MVVYIPVARKHSVSYENKTLCILGPGDLNRGLDSEARGGVMSQISQQLALKSIMKLILMSDVYWGARDGRKRGPGNLLVDRGRDVSG